MHTAAPRFARFITGFAKIYVAMIGVNLALRAFSGYETSNAVHQVVRLLLFGPMLWMTVYMLRKVRLFYEKLILFGTLAILSGFISAIMVWGNPGVGEKLIPEVLFRFPTAWGNLYWYDVKVGVAIDVICFSWALTLRQKMLLQGVVKSAPDQTPLLQYLLNALPPEDEFLCKIRAYLAQKISDENLSVEQVATEAARLSVSQTNRKIKEKTGLTTEQFVLEFRLEKALKLLCNTDQTVSEIAYAVGFREAAHFSNTFKRHFGQSPRDLRKASQGNAQKTQENAE